MSLHKLTAGSGYDYLTRQVAALDPTDKGRTGLASYYTERGESPGVWVGSGMAGVDGLDVGDPVTAEQMRALFGCGLHPLAELRLQQWEGPDLTGQDFRDPMRLGALFKIIDDATPFRVEVAQRIAALNAAIGEPVDVSVAAAERARIRTEVARELFVAEHGGAPMDARELAGQIAKSSRPRAQTVAGFDLTQLTGDGGFLPELVRGVLEAGLQAELTDHLGYEKHDRAGHGSGKSRNGYTSKRLGSEIGDLELATPRDRLGSFEPRLVPNGQRRVAGLSDLVIALYAGGMTIRDSQAHLERTLGTELSHETISNITDAVLEEVRSWQSRPVDEGRFLAVVANHRRA
jgi:Transposase, Mutator family/TrwC relaxase